MRATTTTRRWAAPAVALLLLWGTACDPGGQEAPSETEPRPAAPLDPTTPVVPATPPSPFDPAVEQATPEEGAS